MPAQLGFGTAAIGRPQYINLRAAQNTTPFDLEVFKAEGMAMLDKAYDVGIRYFDTAPGYGIAEEMLLDWLALRKPQDVTVATKWGYTYVANFNPNATQHEVKEHSLAKLKEQWAASRKLLPYLSIYQIHSATFETGVLENKAVLEYLAALKAEFSLKIGLTSTGAHQAAVLQKALEVEVHHKPLFDAFQVTYNILDQSLDAVAAKIKAQNKTLIIKEALANGRLLPNLKHLHYSKLYTYMTQLSKHYKVGIDAIALRFCMDNIASDVVLSGAAVGAHVSANILVNTFELSKKELKNLQTFSIEPEAFWSERKRLAWN